MELTHKHYLKVLSYSIRISNGVAHRTLSYQGHRTVVSAVQVDSSRVICNGSVRGYNVVRRKSS